MVELLQKLTRFLRPLCFRGAALAFSGGVDSSLLLAVLLRMRQEDPFPLLVLNAVTPMQNPEDMENVKMVAEANEVGVEFLPCDVLALPEVRSNSRERCYFCKKELFRQMLERCAREQITTLFEGSHADDMKCYRPGRRALAELGVISPFARLGITKTQIRSLAAMLQVRTAERPSSPCLATRFDYGVVLTSGNLRMAGEGEQTLRKLLPGLKDLRLRVHGKLGRIEVNAENFSSLIREREKIVENLKQLGFEKITLDLAGFCSGSFDSDLKGEKNV